MILYSFVMVFLVLYCVDNTCINIFLYMKWKNHHRQLIIRKKICVYTYWVFFVCLLLDMSGFWMYDAYKGAWFSGVSFGSFLRLYFVFVHKWAEILLWLFWIQRCPVYFNQLAEMFCYFITLCSLGRWHLKFGTTRSKVQYLFLFLYYIV